jgi:hypothetical protein
MDDKIRELVDYYKEKYSSCQLVKKIADKYEGNELLKDPMYLALTEELALSEWRENEDKSMKSKAERIEKEEIYDSELYEDDDED